MYTCTLIRGWQLKEGDGSNITHVQRPAKSEKYCQPGRKVKRPNEPKWKFTTQLLQNRDNLISIIFPFYLFLAYNRNVSQFKTYNRSTLQDTKKRKPKGVRYERKEQPRRKNKPKYPGDNKIKLEFCFFHPFQIRVFRKCATDLVINLFRLVK